MKHLFLLTLFYIVIFASISDAFAATAPDPPTNVSATAVSATQVNLLWSAPTNDGGSGVNSYKIEYKVGSGSYSILVASTGGPTTYYSHTSLTTGTTYTYKISAINNIGTGSPSSEASATPTSSSSGALPGAPTGLTGVAASPTQANLSWTAPTNTGGYPVTGYKIEYRISSGSYSTLVSNTGSTTTSYSHTGLTTNQVYVYRVYTITQFGTSAQASGEAVVQPTSSSALTAPNSPTGLSSTAVSPTQINLSWTAPTNNGGSAITGYKIEVKSGTGTFSNLVSNTGSTTTTYSHTSLTTGTTYTYRVSAINSIGTSSTSSEASATPTSSSTSGTPGSPTGLVATVISSTQINLSWSTPSSNGGYQITGYKIEYKIGSNNYGNLVTNTGTTGTSYSHTSLTSGQLYTYRVSAINSIGTGPASSEASATPTSSSSSANVPGTVTGLTATSASPTQINLSWGAPTNNGGSAVTGYKIESKKGVGAFETLVSNSQSTTTSFSHTGLTTGTSYYYRISAINSVGTGAQSEVSATPKDTTTPTVTATAISPTAITLTWVAPSQTYKQSITGYKIEEKISQDSYRVVQDTVSSTSYSITGLTTGKTYTYVVSAYFTLGSSPRSDEASATPLTTSNASPPSQSTTTSVNPPTNLVATPVSPTQINLSWIAPSTNSAIVGYKIEVKKGPAQFETLTSTQNSTTKYSHTKLVTGTTHAYRIYAITSSGISLASSEASATPTQSTVQAPPINANPPSPPTLSANLVSPTQINLYWSTANNGGSSIIGYKIEYKIGQDSYRTLTSKTTTTTYSHTGLLANTYSYKIYAINSAGMSVASNEVSIKTADPPKPVEQTPEPTKCGVGTVFDDDSGTCVVLEPEPEPEPTIPTTHIPGFPDPTKDPQSYVERYNSEAAYKAWFDRNFPGKTIYEVVGVPEPEPEELQCGTGTHLEKGICVVDEKADLLGGGCLVATAAFGTELAPQVQTLREIRDNVLFSTGSGTAFMTGFNEFYYAFSPTIADLERQNAVFKEAVRIMITPMLSTLSILNYVDVNSEPEMLGYGIGIILINAAMYFGIPAFLITVIRNKIKTDNFKKF
ncbi:MAG: fibronectin type III domain-containing protein [Candidatus Nitrosotenuis sp.]